MKVLINTLSFILIVFCIGFADVSYPSHSINELTTAPDTTLEQECEVEVYEASTIWDEEKVKVLWRKIINESLYKHKVDSCRLSALKESVTDTPYSAPK
ncbi:hypothetical protein [Fulvivirga sediminis]|uniref:Uncharacterized protein n=1 Tax=Fulvivirga sediminis TaxID=2803949 RepID=A0A937F8H3_9BACT|nr:hypothetical protein [Fulvivirga sediminis]MBL3658412.1 hypothetical protein [Fulvivirga sediminis]